MRLLCTLCLALALSVRAQSQLNAPYSALLNVRPAAGGGGSACDSVNDASLVAYWRLDEASGTREDTKGSNDLTDNNTVTSSTGKIGDAADFEADNSEYLSIADNSDLSSGDVDFSIWAWVRPETVAGTIVVNKPDEYGLDMYPDGSAWRFTVNAAYTPVSTGTPVAGTWAFLVGVHDAAANEIKISVNGAAFVTASAIGPTDTGSAFLVGSYNGSSLFFDGLVDEVGFTKRKLTQEEVSALYNSGSACRPSGL